MIQGGFPNKQDRGKLIALARDGSAACRMTRRANALVLFDGRRSCQALAKAFSLDDATCRGCRKFFEQRGIKGLTSFDVGEVIVVSDHGGGARQLSDMSAKQEDDLKAWVGAALPAPDRST